MSKKTRRITRLERRQRIANILAVHPGSSVAEISTIMYKLGTPTSKPTIITDLEHLRQEGWRWMDETARSGYLFRLRMKNDKLIDAFDITHKQLVEAHKTPDQKSLISSLSRALCAISVELREVQADIELRVEWMHKFGGQHNPEWIKAAKEANPDVDKALR